ncbi:hypothetical protein [Methylomonas sp. UP202]|uniref:hypothetical protein n=1 Tax=Methylomonas sp. UP202 TaxID=3040943 RepID=UPI002479594B|nr:hypothetical protein [Methylomonas sp. UP202]WGS86504.1 hypothetical protein QC632_01810 [Methylomonas sp. UP202]
MKKILLIVLSVTILAGCSEKEDYKLAVLEQMKADKDIQDYRISPEIMTNCVVASTSSNMPGLFLLDPVRRVAYKNYTKMLSLNKSSDPKKTLSELRSDFGDPKKLADAHSNFTESVVECMSNQVTSTEESNPQK